MKKIIDERVEQARKEIYAQGFHLLITGMLVIILYSIFVLKQQSINYLPLLCLFIIVDLYISILNTVKTIPYKRQPFISYLILGLLLLSLLFFPVQYVTAFYLILVLIKSLFPKWSEPILGG